MTRPLCALVTGASRGVGRGIAEALGEIGATAYLSGRDGSALAETARGVAALGGRGVPVRCDHREGAQTDGTEPRPLTLETA